MRNKKIAIVYNTSHYIYMFRLNLIESLQKCGYEVFAIAPYDEYSNRLQNLGIKYISIDMDNKGTNPKNDLKLIYDLYKIYKKISPDIILHFTIKPNIYGSIAARFCKIPVINNITGLGTVFLNDNLIQKVTKSLYKFAFQNVNKVFFQNNDDKDLFINNELVDVAKVDLLPGSGVDTKKFAPQKSLNSNEKFIFLLIARVIQDKGIIEYIEAAQSIKEKFTDVEFQLLGQLGTINKSAIREDVVMSWHEDKIINYLGEAEDVRSYITNADCIVLPSYREGTSKTLLEAASMAKPIIATDVPGCNNVVENGKTGLLCKVRDSVDLASKMQMIINLSSQEREVMGKYGRKKMINEFEEKIVIHKYLATIKTIVKEEV